MKRYIFLILIIFLINCKSKPIESIKKENISINNSGIVLENINKRTIDFSTLSIKSNVRFEDENQSQKVNVDIRIKKDEIIWVNVKLLGIPLAKALITPEKVQFFEKINNTYFDGDFRVISNLLGTELNYNKIQNMILGFPLEKINSDKYQFENLDSLYVFSNFENGTEKKFMFNKDNFLLKKQDIIQKDKNIGINIDFENYQNVNTNIFPEIIKILALRTKGNANFDIKYNSISVNEELSYPYVVPNGYKLRNL